MDFSFIRTSNNQWSPDLESGVAMEAQSHHSWSDTAESEEADDLVFCHGGVVSRLPTMKVFTADSFSQNVPVHYLVTIMIF
jgi:hypothetical protein